MTSCTPIWAPVYIVLLGLLSSAAQAQVSLPYGQPQEESSLVEPSMALAMQSFESLGSTGQALDSLPQPLAALLGAPLADAIHQERNRAYPHAQPIPPGIRAQLTPFFPRAVLQSARYSTDWDTTAARLLPHVLLGNGVVQAVTLGDVILFRDTRLAADPFLWAHELTHVEQYRRLGVETFATRYLQQAGVLEQEAITKANMIKGHLAR